MKINLEPGQFFRLELKGWKGTLMTGELIPRCECWLWDREEWLMWLNGPRTQDAVWWRNLSFLWLWAQYFYSLIPSFNIREKGTIWKTLWWCYKNDTVSWYHAEKKHIYSPRHIDCEEDSLDLMCGPGQFFFIKHGPDKPKEWTFMLERIWPLIGFKSLCVYSLIWWVCLWRRRETEPWEHDCIWWFIRVPPFGGIHLFRMLKYKTLPFYVARHM